MTSPIYINALSTTVITAFLSGVALGVSQAEEDTRGWFSRNFVDPQDNHLDLSNWLERGGFIPVPIVLSEPAVNDGLGVAALFVHGGDPEAGIAPNITGGAGIATGNDSTIYAVFHQGNYFKDHVRYVGALADASMNLDFYTGDPNIPAAFNFDGIYSLQNVRVRIADSNLFAGVRWEYLDSNVRFRGSGQPGSEFDLPGTSVRMSALGGALYYDNRDNIFTPEKGINARALWSFDDPSIGSDFSFSKLGISAFVYEPVRENWKLSLKSELETVFGDAPFFAKPFIDLRGIPAVRYQGDAVFSGELELRYEVTERWSVLGFAGLGVAGDDGIDDWRSEDTKAIYGGGFRYLLARDLNLHVGIDVAKGPDETVAYLQFGHAWMRD